MTWMIIRLVLSLAFIAVVLLFAARVARKRGLGQGSGLIEVLAHAFHDWVEMILRSRQLLAEDSAHAAQQAAREHA